MAPPTAVEVRYSRSKGGLLFLGFVVFTAFGVAMILSGDVLTVVIGVVTVLFFGVGGLIATPKLLRAQRHFTVDATGLHPVQGGVVEWADVEALEPYRVAGSGRCLGLRIRDPERYAASLTEPERRGVLAPARAVRAITGTTVDDVVRYYAFQRRHSGWDMAWPQDTMNHDIDVVLGHCERLRGGAA